MQICVTRFLKMPGENYDCPPYGVTCVIPQELRLIDLQSEARWQCQKRVFEQNIFNNAQPTLYTYDHHFPW